MSRPDPDRVTVLDRERAGSRIAEHVPDVADAPVVASMDEAPACDALVIGIAPIGGGFEESWRPDVRTLRRGCDVIAGLHYFLAEEFAYLAGRHGCALWDARRPPEDLNVAEGVASNQETATVFFAKLERMCCYLRPLVREK